MANCPYCTTEIIEGLNFCVECENQVRCLKCGALLYKGKSRCLKCGELLEQSLASQGAMNTYTLEEKSTKSSSYRRIEVKASDSAVGTLTTGLPFGSSAPPKTFNARETLPENLPPALPSGSDKTITIDAANQESSEEDGKVTHSLESDRLFTRNSDYGIVSSKTLRDYILKLSSKKERQQVFAVIYVWAYRELLSESISHGNLVAVMKYEDLHDNHIRTYLSEVAKNYFRTDGDYYELNNYDGVQRVKGILSAIQNPVQPSGVTEVKKSSKRRGRPAGQSNKEEFKKVEPWVAMSIESLENFDVRRLKSASDWGAFGLYILTKILKVEEAVEAGLVYTYLTKKFTTMPISRKSLLNRMGDTEGKFGKSASGAYFLTTKAEAEMKALIEGSGAK